MDPESNHHQQSELTEDFGTPADDDPSTASDSATDVQALVEDYLTAKQTSGSQAYAATAGSVLHRWAAWMQDQGHELETLNDPRHGAQILNAYALHLANRVTDDSLSPASAERYFAYVSACLSFGVRQGALDRNPALADAATESLPTQQRSDRTDQQFWTQDQRRAIVAFVDDRVSQQSPPSFLALRNRALVRVLAYSGVRGAEILSHPKDERDGRNGLRWEHVDLDAGTMLIFGKDQRWERTPLPSNCMPHVRELKQAQDPPATDWPVFPTAHHPSLYSVAREELGNRFKSRLAAVSGDIWELLRDHQLTPPSLTTAGARSLMRRLTGEADIDVEEGYLQLHGGRRGLGDLLYRQDRGHAQDILRHDDLSTTQAAYQHIDAEERRKQLDSYLEQSDEL
ncbi:tyrosine-type recombinase/integrase [Halorarius litoreus]|uniref:tyrosine-type recombinase/integrase n=1 Tax=Halorarius litoreus TaxID=2962676 RepID=UPI0020CF5051|nr:tyrosine-type recombinase/integrase [Halorarius litoreus]